MAIAQPVTARCSIRLIPAMPDRAHGSILGKPRYQAKCNGGPDQPCPWVSGVRTNRDAVVELRRVHLRDAHGVT